MSAASAQAQEAAWLNVGRSDKGGASYISSNPRPLANTPPVVARSRGEANILPNALAYRDSATSAWEALTAEAGKKLKSEADDRMVAALPKTDYLEKDEWVFALATEMEKSGQALAAYLRPRTSQLHIGGLSEPPAAFEAYEGSEPTFVISRDTAMPTWLTTDKLIAGLLGLIATLISVVYLNVKSDVDDLKKFSLEMPKQISDLKVSLTGSIKDVEKQAAITNSRLDLILEELKRPQRR
jgi:hypothetical protein